MAFDAVNIPSSDSLGRMVSRTLLQFRNSPVFQGVLAAFAKEVQALLDATRDVMRYRTAAEAQGVNLEAIGRIVGQGRVLFDYNSIAWFAPDSGLQKIDQTPAWVSNAPLSGDVEVNDTIYRQLIEGKVYRNFCSSGSVPEIQDVVKKTFGIDVSFIRTDAMTVKMVVPDGTPLGVINFLSRVGDSDQADSVYFLPFPATLRIAQVVYLSDLEA